MKKSTRPTLAKLRRDGSTARRGQEDPAQGTCGWCGRRIRLRADSAILAGRLYKHRTPGPDGMSTWCPGGGELPDRAIHFLNRLQREVLDKLGDPLDNTSEGLSGFPVGLLACGPGEINETQQTPPREILASWWRGVAETEIDMVVDKAIEYGATDLRDTGHQILEMGSRRGDFIDSASDAYATEVGIVFYVLGKVSRLAAAVKEGRQPSLDTWVDIGVYARMAQRVQQVGSWPGV